MPIYVTILISIVGLFVLISVIVAIVFSTIVIRSHRQPIVTTPQEYGMDYEKITFESTDGLKIKGWYIPAPPNGTPNRVIVITHPMPFNRHGFQVENQGFPPLFKTDVDLLTTAQAMHQAGYAVMMFDLRNHGESEQGTTGNGLSEYQDVLGAIIYLTERFGETPFQIGFVSFCMGASSTMIALSKAEGFLENVKFLVAIQPVSADVFFRSYMKSVYTPLSLYLLPLVGLIVRLRGGYPLKQMTPEPVASQLPVPTFYIQAKHDPWTNLSDIQSFYEATPEPKDLWLIEDIAKRFETYNYIGQHPERVIAWAREYFS